MYRWAGIKHNAHCLNFHYNNILLSILYLTLHQLHCTLKMCFWWGLMWFHASTNRNVSTFKEFIKVLRQKLLWWWWWKDLLTQITKHNARSLLIRVYMVYEYMNIRRILNRSKLNNFDMKNKFEIKEILEIIISHH